MRLLILLLLIATLSACSFTPVSPGTTHIFDEYTGMEAVTVGPIQIERGIEWELARATQTTGDREGESIIMLTVNRNGAVDSTVSGWRFLRNNRMDLIVDGKRHTLGSANHDGDARIAGAGGVYVLERLTYQLKPEVIRAISGGFSVFKGRVSDLEFILNSEQTRALNQFIDTEITPYVMPL